MSTPRRNRLRHECGAQGFTLIELLVSMAIFVTIMSGVTLMFNSAVRVTKQAYLNQAAFETVRGTFDTIERDLTRSFVSRESGHKHTFYGTPIGFTFIGLVSTDGTDEYNLARITYVMYGGLDNSGLTKRYKATIDDENAEDDLRRTTYSLLRYIEPGVEDLESFPIYWKSEFPLDNDPDFEKIIQDAKTDASSNGLCFDDSCLEEIGKAKRRELWIRMLAGDPNLPNFWTATNLRTDETENPLLDPADYVLAENILHIDRNTTRGFDPNPFEPDDNRTYKARTPLEDTTVFDRDLELIPPFIPFIDPAEPAGWDMAVIEALDPFDSDYINTDAGKIRDYIEDFDPNRAIVYTHQNYFFAYREYAETGRTKENDLGQIEPVFKVTRNGELLNGDGTSGVILQENELVASLFAFWNDTRNLEHNTVLSIVNTQDNRTNTVNATDEQISTQPDILDPTLPESIMIQLAFFYPSPYPGAPDFEKIFTHTINLPTAYKRKQETLWTKQVRN